VPSSVSAIKVDGRRSHARVRAGEEFELPPRRVVVNRFDVLGMRRDTAQGAAVLDVEVEVEVSSGTYVRALARDLGMRLGVGGHLTALRRTAVGPYGLAGARTLEQLAEHFEVRPLAEAARAVFPARELTAAEVQALRFGTRLNQSGAAGPVAAFDPEGSLVALLVDQQQQARSLFVLPSDH
jgi:tRNA pseudouridine55 synthase